MLNMPYTASPPVNTAPNIAKLTLVGLVPGLGRVPAPGVGDGRGVGVGEGRGVGLGEGLGEGLGVVVTGFHTAVSSLSPRTVKLPCNIVVSGSIQPPKV